MATERQIAANRKNSEKSTGPRTLEGKERSRRNGLKHGLTGQGVVLADEDVSEVEQRAAALMAELDPRSTLGSILVGQMATLSVRMERGARHQEAALARRVRHAPEDFDRERVEWAEALFEAMRQADDPRPASRELRHSPEGVDRLLAGWADLRADLTRSTRVGWGHDSFAIAARMAGLRLADAEASRLGVLFNAALGSFQRLAEGEGAGLDDNARRRWAADRLVEWVDAEVERLRALRQTLDFETIERDRAGSADLALFDPSHESSLARRYESEARRDFFKALKEFRRVEAEVVVEPAPEAEIEPAPEFAPPRASLGSCREQRSPVASSPVSPSAEIASGRDRPVSPVELPARGFDGRVLAVGRASFGPG